MHFYDVWVADSRFQADKSLTYHSEEELPSGAVITIPLRNKMTTAFVAGRSNKPSFATKPIKNLISQVPMPAHSLPLAHWMSKYYCASLGECLRQFAPSKPTVRQTKPPAQTPAEHSDLKMILDAQLGGDQSAAIKKISAVKTGSTLLHGQTGSGKTRVYLELAKNTLAKGLSVIILTPEISLITQLQVALADYLHARVFVMHSKLPQSQRKKTWLGILESTDPVVVIGPRSALFAPVQKPGLIVLDEAHEPAYKQEQSPHYQTARVASQLAHLTGSVAVFGTATPAVADYYLASQKNAVVKMSQQALNGNHPKTVFEVIDIKNRANFSRDSYLSNQLIEAVDKALAGNQQALIYLNRRGSARVILCNKCGWQALCPNCDIPLVYHGDSHRAICHTCGFWQTPPVACPTCGNSEIIYRSIGTKALAETVQKLFPNHRVGRFDSDSGAGESLHDHWQALRLGKIDILVGTQLLAKGLDLPRLGMVGVVTAESSLSLPDYTAEERTFQLLYQVVGRVGRGHGKACVVVQCYDPKSKIIKAAIERDYSSFYKSILKERQAFRFPPYAYLLKLTVRRATPKGALIAAEKLKKIMVEQRLPVEIIGPAPSFFGKRGKNYYWQIVVKSKNRGHLVQLASLVPQGWSIDLDPTNLL